MLSIGGEGEYFQGKWPTDFVYHFFVTFMLEKCIRYNNLYLTLEGKQQTVGGGRCPV